MKLSRLEQVLALLAQQHNLYPANLPADAEQRSRALAKILAKEGILVLAGDVPPAYLADREALLIHWVQLQVQFYKLLAEAFFPSFATFKPPMYADRELPALVVMDADSAAVTEGLAKIIIPYIGMRQGQSLVFDGELRGMMQLILQDLDPQKSRDHDTLTVLGIPLLKQWLANPIVQIPLVEPENPLYEELQAAQPPTPQNPTVPSASLNATAPTPQPPVTPAPPSPPPPPNSLPELDKLISQPAKTDTDKLFVSKVPMFFGKKSSGWSPFPPPPKKKNGE